ncbi:hypothetical protein ACETAC_03925 [Aceticella autotrophica]|uniref:Uncharacterized protein n=1 Tax=Aceticella autotrophica TaxID=2755338 RepID=A0A975GBC2_9THEO|nr:hypothetical protein [Aceticella autotrophica]QSZ28016.1 hypothetical protein ACETAC_03925 [Aceticella autotrophica]
MRNEATLDEWKELYDIAIKIKELKPWEYLYDMDIITIILSDSDEPIYSSIMGKAGEFFGIGSYVGYDAINDFYMMAKRDDVPGIQKIRFQDDNVLMCHFGNREELTKEELKLVKDLGLKFRGRNNWIYFHSFKKGYIPYLLNKEEVLLETKIFKQLFLALKDYIEGNVKVNFEKGNTLLRMHNKIKNLWISQETPILLPEPDYARLILQDELLIERINRQKINKSKMEVDIAYLNGAIRDKKYDVPISERLCIFAENISGLIIDQHFIFPDDDEKEIVLGMTVDYILTYGKPDTIIVRDNYILNLLYDLCKRAGIKLKVSGRLKTIDYFVENF